MEHDIMKWFHRLDDHIIEILKEIRKAPTVPSCYTKKEVAARLNISARKLQYMIADEEIIGFYVGNEWRMKPENLERWIDKRQEKW